MIKQSTTGLTPAEQGGGWLRSESSAGGRQAYQTLLLDWGIVIYTRHILARAYPGCALPLPPFSLHHPILGLRAARGGLPFSEGLARRSSSAMMPSGTAKSCPPHLAHCQGTERFAWPSVRSPACRKTSPLWREVVGGTRVAASKLVSRVYVLLLACCAAALEAGS